MNIKILVVAVLSAIVAVIGFKFYENQTVCKDPTSSVELVNVPILRRGNPIYLRFKMARDGNPGCMSEKTSDTFQNVACNYRTDAASPWTAGAMGTIIDNETEYLVECQFPRLFNKNPINLEYALEYLAWGKNREQKTGTVAVQ